MWNAQLISAKQKMKRINLLVISIFSAIMIAFYGSIILWAVSCDKEKAIPEFRDVKMTMTLDSLYKMAADSGLVNLRASHDGIFDWLTIGDNFGHSDEWIFNQQTDSLEAFIKTVHPFDSLWPLGKLVFHRKLAQGNFNCKSTGGLDAALVCSWPKIMKAAFGDGLNPDFVHIFSLNNGFGTGNAGIGILGIGIGQPSSVDLCYYWQKLPRLSGHEDGHGMGLDHFFDYPNLMWFCTNGGCDLAPFYIPTHQQIIVNYINSRIN